MSDNNRRSFEKWRTRIDFFRKEYPFGPIQQKVDMLGRLHCETGPAYISPTRCTWYNEGKRHGMDVDIFGTQTCFYEGVHVPRHFIFAPETLTIEEVLAYQNTEVRYAGMKIVGFESLRNSPNFKTIDKGQDQYGRDWELFQVHGILRGEPLTVVKVVNGSPEPDGTYKNYYLQVPPEMRTCHEAVAWTFRKTADEYKPDVET